MDTFTAPLTALRLLTPLKMSYEAAKKRAEPYNTIVGELPDAKGNDHSYQGCAAAESAGVCAGENRLEGVGQGRFGTSLAQAIRSKNAFHALGVNASSPPGPFAPVADVDR